MTRERLTINLNCNSFEKHEILLNFKSLYVPSPLNRIKLSCCIARHPLILLIPLWMEIKYHNCLVLQHKYHSRNTIVLFLSNLHIFSAVFRRHPIKSFVSNWVKSFFSSSNFHLRLSFLSCPDSYNSQEFFWMKIFLGIILYEGNWKNIRFRSLPLNEISIK